MITGTYIGAYNKFQMIAPLVGAGIVAGASAIAGQGIQMGATKLNNTKTYERTQKLMDKQQAMNQQMALFNQKQQMEMWEKTGPQGQMEQIKKAGLNPALMYGTGGGQGGTTQAAQAAPVSGGSYHGDNPGAGAGQLGIQLGAQLALMQAQKENIEADTKNKLEQSGLNAAQAINAPLTGEQIKAQTKNLSAAEPGITAASNEAKDYYEQVKKPNRGIEAKTWEDELGARQATAETIYEMWQEGKLKEKSLADVEQAVLQNAKTFQETRNIQKTFDLIQANLKGTDLENAMREIDLENLKIGVGKNANTAERILGTIYRTLIGRK